MVSGFLMIPCRELILSAFVARSDSGVEFGGHGFESHWPEAMCCDLERDKLSSAYYQPRKCHDVTEILLTGT